MQFGALGFFTSPVSEDPMPSSPLAFSSSLLSIIALFMGALAGYLLTSSGRRGFRPSVGCVLNDGAMNMCICLCGCSFLQRGMQEPWRPSWETRRLEEA